MEAIIAVPIVPRGEQTALQINLQRVLEVEARGDEIAVVTPQRAPELLATFNRAYLDSTEAFSRLKLEQARADDAVNRIKAEILLDRIPGILKEKGIGSSADIRQAIIDADPDYQAAKERVDMIEAMIEYVKGKTKYLENCYTSIKKIMDTGNWNLERRAGGKALDGMLDETAPVGGQARKFGDPR